MTIAVDLDHLAVVVMVKFLNCTGTNPLPLLYAFILVEFAMHSPHTMSGSYAPPLLEYSTYLFYLEFCKGDLVQDSF